MYPRLPGRRNRTDGICERNEFTNLIVRVALGPPSSTTRRAGRMNLLFQDLSIILVNDRFDADEQFALSRGRVRAGIVEERDVDPFLFERSHDGPDKPPIPGEPVLPRADDGITALDRFHHPGERGTTPIPTRELDIAIERYRPGSRPAGNDGLLCLGRRSRVVRLFVAGRANIPVNQINPPALRTRFR